MRRWVMALLVPSLLAGCVTETDDPADALADGGAILASQSEAVPSTCDLERPAIVHGVGGAAVEWTGPRGIACFASTDWGTAEPSIGLTSSGTLFVYPAIDAVVDEETGLAGRVAGLGMARSFDDGQSFDHRQSTVGPANYQFFTADPFMFVDTYTDRIFMEDLAVPPFNCANLSYSDDEGETWTQGVAGCMVWDHVGWASGPAIVSDPSWPVVIQRCAITYVATTLASQATGCQKSLDGGVTWELPGEPAFLFDQTGTPYVPSTCHGAAHHPFIDHRGWTWLGRTWCDGKPWVAVSQDEGATWTRHKINDEAVDWHDVGIGVDPAGTAYAFWVDSDLRPLLAVSKDDGATWSEPMDIAPEGVTGTGMLNIQPGGVGKAAFSYVATVDGWPGNHAVVVAGFELDTDTPRFHTAFATDADAPLTDGGCGGGTCSGQADFLDVSVGPDGTPWGSFTHVTHAAAGRLWGAPSLWDAEDPNGTYAD